MNRERFKIENPEIDIEFLVQSELVDAAFSLMVMAHEGEERRILKQPFIVHPIGAARIVSRYPDQHIEYTQALALVHDVFDSKIARERVTYSQLKETLGSDVAYGVLSASKAHNLSDKAAQRADFLKTRLTENDQRIQRAVCADKMDNLQAASRELMIVGNDFWRHFDGGREVYMKWPIDVLNAIRASHSLDGHKVLDDYQAEIDSFYEVVANVDVPNKAS